MAPDGVASEGADTLTLLGDVDIAPLLGVDDSGRCVLTHLLVDTRSRALTSHRFLIVSSHRQAGGDRDVDGDQRA